jgi:hypothetical protein
MVRGLQFNGGLKLTALTCVPFGTDLWKQNKEAARQLKDTDVYQSTESVIMTDVNI